MAGQIKSTEIVEIEGGEFLMGSDDFYPEERPRQRVRVESFAIDCCPVTNAEFARFVEATGHITVAERPIDSGNIQAPIPKSGKVLGTKFWGRGRCEEIDLAEI
jgi:sulfatase modifying factor 1